MVNRDITHTSPKRKGKTQELSCLPKLPQLRHWFLILNLIPADSQIIHLFVKASHVIYVHVDSRCAWQENHFSAGKVLWKDLKTSTPASMGICPAAVFATSRTADSSFISVSYLMSILIFILTHNLTLTFIQADLGAIMGFPVGPTGKEAAFNGGDLGWEDPLEKGMATHPSILAWRIPWAVQSMGSQRVRHDWLFLSFTVC